MGLAASSMPPNKGVGYLRLYFEWNLKKEKRRCRQRCKPTCVQRTRVPTAGSAGYPSASPAAGIALESRLERQDHEHIVYIHQPTQTQAVHQHTAPLSLGAILPVPSSWANTVGLGRLRKKHLVTQSEVYGGFNRSDLSTMATAPRAAVNPPPLTAPPAPE